MYGAEAQLAIVHFCFPIQLTCREERSPRIRLPTLKNVLTDTHTYEATSDFNFLEARKDLWTFKPKLV